MDARDVGTQAKKNLTSQYSSSVTPIIVSEGYLGEIMRPHEITLDKAKEERRKLERIYSEFFA